jgi:AraC-like DNA-binding protein
MQWTTYFEQPLSDAGQRIMNSGQNRYLTGKRTVSAAFIEAMLVIADQLGLHKSHLCNEVGLDTELLLDPSNRIDEAIMLSLFDRIVAQSGKQDFGLIMGQQSRPGTYSALGYAVMNCASLKDAFHLVPRFEDVVMEIGRTRIDTDHDQVKLVWGTQDDAPCPRALIDSILSSWIFLASWLTGKPLIPDITQLSYAEPQDISLHQNLFGRDVRFKCEENAFTFLSSAALDEKVLQADRAMSNIMKQRVIALQNQLKSDRPISQSIVAELIKKMPVGLVALSDVAVELETSERTLRRRLREEGSSYQKLLTKLRHQLACDYLGDPALSILDIALLLGYTEHSSFTAAFKNWQGEPPVTYRMNQKRPC